MDIIEITPFVGCGKVKFGMDRAEVEQHLTHGDYEPNTALSRVDASVEFPTVHGFYPAYPGFAGNFYRIGFREDKVTEISLFAPGDTNIRVQLFGVELFQKKAADVIAELEQHEKCSWDTDDKDLSYTYTFDHIGFSLWREGVFHPKLYEDEAYMENFRDMIPENQEEELKFQYFQVATIQSMDLYAQEKAWRESLNL